ncbi:putrescine/spermidine ABC transporter permease [Paractinoplanes abujensis]|uniref:Spermidine/putrescine transport system permease protein n=1 Tax=Paractinoplanes abujensis TaxID=882441 RepID=A0A7W7CVI1_9ACTN|nr:ABC transporter permease [Actinoplanes abujensis]MBB4694053.1 spermidine/putrescine transport system permease protein [Actinoplanes abujensis]GID20732.1 putrescine/spermidine ABC transporter permease [Actinoplanes abujensis]
MRRIPLGLTLVFLYVPIVVVVVMSFNAGDSPFNWNGFSLKWYGELAADEQIRTGLGNTLIVAAGSTALSTVLGTLLAVGLARHTRSTLLDAIATLPVILPDIVLAIGLLAFYALVQLTLGLYSVLLAHAVFGTAAVAAVVRTRLSTTDPSLEEASRDLGANGFTTFWRVTLPTLAPGVVAGALLAFTLSVDEFVIAFFTAGPQSPTLPIVIYSMVRFGVTPEINALATVLLAVTFTAILAVQRLTRLAGTR